MNEELNAKVEAAQRLLVELTEGDFAEHQASANMFMSYVFDICRIIERHPGLADDEPFQSFLKETRSRLVRLLSVLGLFVTRTLHMLGSNWEDDEWRYVCERRSAIEFLRKLFPTPGTDELLNTEDVDEMIRTRGQDEGYIAEASIPVGIPPSHWWWWYPGSPPSVAQDSTNIVVED